MWEASGSLWALCHRYPHLEHFAKGIGGPFLAPVPNGFFMNWGGKQKGERIEFHLLAATIFLVSMSKGGDGASVDLAIHDAPYTGRRA